MPRALVLALLLALTLAAPARAFDVNSTVDAVDAAPGDGACASAAGTCTLRAAVQEANAALLTPATIVLPAGRYQLSIKPLPEAGSLADMDASNGDLDVLGTVDLRGAPQGTIVDGGGVDRVFETGVTANLHLSDLTVTGGDATAGNSQEIDLGGGILNKGAITLDRVTLVGNKADGGGGMFSIPGTMPLVRDSLVTRNTAYSGGGLRIDHGGHIINTTITDNTLIKWDAADFSGKPVGIVIPTVDEISGWGGGIDHRGGADLTIESSTIVGNHAVKGGGGIGAGQGYAPLTDAVLGHLILKNTIVAGNTSDAGGQCRTNQVKFVSAGHNIASDSSCFLGAAGDRATTNPLLGPLVGSPLLAPQPGSPAIDAGAGCPPADARGVARPQGAACDIGAVEFVAAAVTKPRCSRTVGVPRTLLAKARSYDVLDGRKVLRRRVAALRRVATRRTRVTLRVRLRSGRAVKVTVRSACQGAASTSRG